jgi:predicted MFS family arabinose efflux permease
MLSPDVDESRIRYEGWRVAAAAGAGVYFAALVVVTFPVLLKPLTAEFSWSRQAVSTAFAIAALTAAACATPLGLLLDRIDARWIVVPCLALLGVTFASLAWLSPELWHLYLVFAVLGAVGVGTSPLAYGRTVASWFDRRRGLALAIVITGGALGGMLHPPIASKLASVIGWRGACLTLGISVLVLGTPLALRYIRARPSESATPAALTGATLAAGMRSRAMWLLIAIQFIGTMLQNSVIVHLSALLTDRGLSPEQGAIALSAMACAAVVGRVLTGILIDRLFAPRVATVLMTLAVVGTYLLSDARSFGLGVLAAVLIGFGTGGESDVIPYLVTRYFGLRSFSALFGMAWMANAIGGALGPVMMGRAFDLSGSYQQSLLQLSLAALIATGLTLVLPAYDRGAGSRIASDHA